MNDEQDKAEWLETLFIVGSEREKYLHEREEQDGLQD